MGILILLMLAGRMNIDVLTQPKMIELVIGLPDLDARYRWLSVYGCSAAMNEDNTSFCTGDFERESSQELDMRKQITVIWRDVPPGYVLVTVFAFDGDRKILARKTRLVLR